MNPSPAARGAEAELSRVEVRDTHGAKGVGLAAGDRATAVKVFRGLASTALKVLGPTDLLLWRDPWLSAWPTVWGFRRARPATLRPWRTARTPPWSKGTAVTRRPLRHRLKSMARLRTLILGLAQLGILCGAQPRLGRRRGSQRPLACRWIRSCGHWAPQRERPRRGGMPIECVESCAAKVWFIGASEFSRTMAIQSTWATRPNS